MHRSGRSAALIFRKHFGGHSEMVAARAWQRMLIEEAGKLAYGVDTRWWVDSFSQVHRIAFESCEEFIIERMFGVVGASIDRIGAEVCPVGEVEFEESVSSDGSVRLLDTRWA